jgi:1,4-dihydroxy-2-naphthoate octaprenyltransferase
MKINHIITLFRFPFSFFLMPVFFYALSIPEDINWQNCFIMFFALHLFLFPSSNAYNSFMDQDKDSIGGVQNPPPSDQKLFYASVLFDFIGLALCLFVSLKFMLGMLTYTLVSRAYSWHGIRLKKYPFLSFFSVVIFQGAWIFYFVLNEVSMQVYSVLDFTNSNSSIAALICSLNLAAMYPITQVFQHQQDKEQNVLTLSRFLGIKGTFYFSSSIFPITGFLSLFYFYELNFLSAFFVWLLMSLPTMLYFFYWMFKVLKDEKLANYKHCMRLNLIASISMNIFYIGLFYYQQAI